MRRPTRKNHSNIVETIQDTHVDSAGRRLYISGPIDEALAHKVIVGLHKLEDAGHDQITIVLNSTGGSWYDALAIMDAMMLSPCPIVVIGMGAVMSAAVPILQAGEKRVATPFCRIMIHNGSWYLGEAHASVVVSTGKEQLSTNEVYAKILASRSKLSVRKWMQLCEKETFMSADAALKYGLIDEICTPDGPITSILDDDKVS